MARCAAEGMRDVTAVGFPEPTDLNQLCYISIHSAQTNKRTTKKIHLDNKLKINFTGQYFLVFPGLDEADLAMKALISSP